MPTSSPAATASRRSGLRYFNVFGTRQDPEGAYAAVIPRWIRAIARGEAVTIHGDGETSRDFCFVANAVQANLRAAVTTDAAALNQVYNVAVGQRTTLNGLFETLGALVRERQPGLKIPRPVHEAFRAGDVRHSQADIGKAYRLLGYAPTHDLRAGLQAALPWYLARYAQPHQQATHAV